jgi:hypothetical protein
MNLEIHLLPADDLAVKGGQTAILVRWSAAQRTTEMLLLFQMFIDFR